MEEQIHRKEHLTNACSSEDLNVTREFNEQISFTNFLVDTKHKLLYCYIPKVRIDI